MSYLDVVKSIPGLTHYYPLTADAQDVMGGLSGTNNGATFSSMGATFNGKVHIDLGDHGDFSAATTGGLTIALFLTIADWEGAGASEYVHWMGKGEAGRHEWTFRHYVKGGSGEARSRRGRMSFYHFNPEGGLGAGSYHEDGTFPTTERLVTATADMKQTALYVNGQRRGGDLLSSYGITPQTTGSPVRIGTRDTSTGFLIGTVRSVAFWDRVLTDAEIARLWEARSRADSGISTPTLRPP